VFRVGVSYSRCRAIPAKATGTLANESEREHARRKTGRASKAKSKLMAHFCAILAIRKSVSLALFETPKMPTEHQERTKWETRASLTVKFNIRMVIA
jgi:hypothetical protein